jgi:hypothetical protein
MKLPISIALFYQWSRHMRIQLHRQQNYDMFMLETFHMLAMACLAGYTRYGMSYVICYYDMLYVGYGIPYASLR